MVLALTHDWSEIRTSGGRPGLMLFAILQCLDEEMTKMAQSFRARSSQAG